jgi:quercetin dioxygenase-like cupin family protein
MAKAGDTIENPATGEKMTFLQTANETEGRLLQIDMSVRPGGFAAAEHVHPRQQERFVIKAGQITLRIDGDTRHCTAGDEVTIPAQTPHGWWNSGKEELRVLLEFRPAGRFDHFITSFFALAHVGQANARGLPRNFLQLAVMFRAYSDVIYGTRPPRAVQKAVFAVLYPLARLLGYRADVPYPHRHPNRPKEQPERARRINI